MAPVVIACMISSILDVALTSKAVTAVRRARRRIADNVEAVNAFRKRGASTPLRVSSDVVPAAAAMAATLAVVALTYGQLVEALS